MRRFISILLVAGAMLTLTAGLQAAPGPATDPLDGAKPPGRPAGSGRIPVTLTPVDGRPERIPFSVNAAADTCEAATALTSIPGGDQSTVNLMTESAADPVLSCTFGTPPPPRGQQGYRTVWYRFTAPYSGQATVETLFSSYDTILAVYQGSCATLASVACNDDAVGFTSRVTFPAIRDQTYFIEVADWQSGVTGQAQLSLAAWIDAVDTFWTAQAPLLVPRTRHAVVSAGFSVYVLGGMSELASPPTLSNSFRALDVLSGGWTNLASLPGGGLANTSMVHLNGKIYVPGGYDGNNNTFSSKHWVYDIGTDFWSEGPAPPWPAARPLAYGRAVLNRSSAILPGYFYAGGTPDVPPFEPFDDDTPAIPAAEVLYFFADSGTWTDSLFPELLTARFSHVAGWLGGGVCVAGGLGYDDTLQANILLSDGECYRPGTGSWTQIADMAIPRYNAGSAVGVDGKWYVFGGIDATGNAVERTERYDPVTDAWTLLSASYDLGNVVVTPPRAWSQGAFVGDTLWAIGGNMVPQNSVLPLVEKLTLILPRIWFPYITSTTGPLPPVLPNNTFATAYALGLNLPQFHNFDIARDFFDTYFFDLATQRRVTIRLSQIPSGSDYDLALYNSNKLLWSTSQNPGRQDEAITVTLAPGRYYIMVQRVFPGGTPNPALYRILVEG